MLKALDETYYVPPPPGVPVVDKVSDSNDQIVGYIFMCNTVTKPECYMYRVFGLPASRLSVVKKIKPNTKLFLFDFDAKLLYGLYVADSSGKLALEPYAFGGKFPAQVKFSILRDCLPLPEVAFKEAIKENYYHISKFNQELNEEQVNKLVSMFRPINVPSVVQQPSLAFQDGVRSLFQKYVDPNQQLTRSVHMHHERSVPEAPQVSYASYYGQNQIPPSSVGPSSSMLPSRASRLVAIASEALNSNIRPSSREPGVSHAYVSYNGPGTQTVGHGYQDQAYHSSHHTSSWTIDQGVSSRPIYEHELNPNLPSRSYHGTNSATSNYSYGYQGDLALSQTQWLSNNGVGSDNSYLYYNGTNSATSNYSYGYQGDRALSQAQQSVSSRVGLDNSYLHYNDMNSITTTTTYDYGNQGYYSFHQPVQQVNNVATAGAALHRINPIGPAHLLAK